MNRADFLFEKIDAHKRGYRPLPFWSLNDALTPEETARQVREMSEQGCGGYFMHARSGLLTDYMGGEWFRCLDSAVEQGSALGADSYVYDENGWPSGFADGAVVRAARAKAVRRAAGRRHGERLAVLLRYDAAG